MSLRCLVGLILFVLAQVLCQPVDVTEDCSNHHQGTQNLNPSASMVTSDTERFTPSEEIATKLSSSNVPSRNIGAMKRETIPGDLPSTLNPDSSAQTSIQRSSVPLNFEHFIPFFEFIRPFMSN